MRSLTQRSVLAAAGSIILPVFMLGCGVNATQPADGKEKRKRKEDAARCFVRKGKVSPTPGLPGRPSGRRMWLRPWRPAITFCHSAEPNG